MYDAIVVGARCAGSSTARLLAQQGLSVLVVDRAAFPSDTVSTHCVGSPGVALLKRWGLFDRMMATNVTNPKTFGLRIGDMELGDAIPVPEDSHGTISPRRTVLDKLLIDAAVEEGATVRESVTVKDVIVEGGRVVGIRGHDADNKAIEERATIVIGADGIHSFVAKAVGAEEYDSRPSRGSGTYAYWSGTNLDLPNLAFSVGYFGFSFPTNDGLVCMGAAKDDDFFADVTGGGDESVLTTLEKASPRLAEQMRGAKRETRYFAFRAQPGVFRKAFGDGWALVGDAGIYKDPVTGHGITDAFVQAQMLADAVTSGLGGTEAMPTALAGFERRRDDFTREIYDITQEIASLSWTEESLLGIFLRFGATLEKETLEVAAFA
jgi:flavin-dependent dehydrogenase